MALRFGGQTGRAVWHCKRETGMRVGIMFASGPGGQGHVYAFGRGAGRDGNDEEE